MVTIWIKRRNHTSVTCTDYEAEVLVRPEERISHSLGWRGLGKGKKTSHPDSPQISIRFLGQCKSRSDHVLQPLSENVEAGMTISATEAVRLAHALILAATDDVRRVRLSRLEKRWSLKSWKLKFRGVTESASDDE
jgi:hypothetical protein